MNGVSKNKKMQMEILKKLEDNFQGQLDLIKKL